MKRYEFGPYSICIYPTPYAIVSVFASANEFPYRFQTVSIVDGTAVEGEEVVFDTVDDLVRQIEKSGRWGFAEANRLELHLWYTGRVTLRELLAMVYHEFGHLQRPHHRTPHMEEKKAEAFSFSAMVGIDLVCQLHGLQLLDVSIDELSSLLTRREGCGTGGEEMARGEQGEVDMVRTAESPYVEGEVS